MSKPDTLGDRLRLAIDHRGISIRSFVEELSGESVRGTTYPTVNSYLHGEASPSVEWIEVAADHLGVSPAWLAFGYEPSFPSIVQLRDELHDAVDDSIVPCMEAHGE